MIYSKTMTGYKCHLKQVIKQSNERKVHVSSAINKELNQNVLGTRRLHHARPELRLFVQRVIVRAVQFVDVNAGRRGQTAVMADEHVKGLHGRKKKKNMTRLNNIYNYLYSVDSRGGTQYLHVQKNTNKYFLHMQYIIYTHF